jgi:uncharacterized phage protein (TIGR02218 family)
MKTANSALIALFASGAPFFMADLYTLTLINGTVLRYAMWDADIIYQGSVFSSSGPGFQRSKIRCVIGVEVDTLDLTVYPGPTNQINGQGWLAAATAGALDGATLRVDRVFMMSPPAVVGGIIHFTGTVSQMIVGRTEAKVTVSSYFQLLNIQMPRNLFQPGCLRTLYDSGCSVSRAAVAVSARTDSATATAINTSTLGAYPAGYFDAGYIMFTSGALSGTRRTIKSFISPTAQLLSPLPSVPAAGDLFSIYPGCDKSQATCQNKFNNLPNFRAMPYIPVPETSQ